MRMTIKTRLGLAFSLAEFRLATHPRVAAAESGEC
jgi:hypothetical protein